MPKFKIVVQDKQVVIKSKEFSATSLEEAIELAYGEDWSGDDWNEEYTDAECEILDNLCEQKD